MQVNKRYKHNNALDTAFHTSHLVDETNSTLTFEGGWFNISYTPHFFIEVDTITINKSDLDNWRQLDEPIE